MADGSVTTWVGRLKAGDAAAASPLWDAYFGRLVLLARDRLRGAGRPVADEEDAALSAFNSFCAAAAGGRFPQLADRTTLWPLLAALTRHKCVDIARREARQKRGGGRKREDALDDLLAREPSPELAAQITDELNHRLARLDACGDPDLRVIALARLDGEGPAEIAHRVGCARRTVERKLTLIARLWDDAEAA
jgi:DNA-directed RNA polymerase specialized sigma24 family protein